MTFDVGKNHAKFDMFKDCESSSSTISCCGCEAVVFYKHVNLIDACPNNPHNFYYHLFERQGLDDVKVKPLPPSIIKYEPYAIDEGYLSKCYGL